MDEDGVTFRSHLDGSAHRLTPEIAHRDPAPARRHHHHGVRRMHALSRHARARRASSMELSMRWAARCRGRRSCRGPATPSSASSRAACIPDLRAALGRRAAARSASRATRSAASRSARARRPCSRSLDATVPLLPADRPRYLMGVGTPDDLLGARAARHRHVRLRDADPRRPHRPRLHRAAACSTCATPATPTTRRRSTPAAPAPPAPGIAAPTCTTCSAPTRCWGRCC